MRQLDCFELVARLEEKIRDTEESIEKLEAEKIEIGTRLQQGIDDHRELAGISIRFDEIEAETEALLAEWEEAHRKLEG